MYEEKYRQQKIQFIARQAAKQGFALMPLANPV
jgi:hypothetical protein